jgi:hypothetical protein
MSVTTQDLFGAASGGQPAVPGSYGEAPRGGHRLPDATRLGPVQLQVADLARSLAFYEGCWGCAPWRPPQGARRCSAPTATTPRWSRCTSGRAPAR